MKTQTLPKLTLTLLALSAAFVFTGCNADGDRVVVQSKTQQRSTAHPSQSTAIPANAPAAEETMPVSKVSEAQQQEYLDLINAARAETQDCGSLGVFDPAPALRWNVRLGNAAYEHSNDMAQSDTFSHTGSGTASDVTAQQEGLGRGSKFSERIKHQGYTNYRTVGENIAAGYPTPEEAVEAWLESDHHCANLMNPAYKEVGMALVEKQGSEYGTYWSQEFGAQ